jgi:tRNA U55 pseudouridine synthase TruB
MPVPDVHNYITVSAIRVYCCRDPNDRQLVHFFVGCTKGTHIRTLGHQKMNACLTLATICRTSVLLQGP